ncbi:hypothetical protein V6Z11_1Z003800 [Gossypium hirsutum]
MDDIWQFIFSGMGVSSSSNNNTMHRRAADGTQTATQPQPMPPADDPATDAIVSWSPTNNSFVVWNPPEFARDLLPKYFKHNNFSSFGFLRGQKHLLRNISRRKPAMAMDINRHNNHMDRSSSMGACVEELVRLRQQQQTTDNQLQNMVQRLQGMEQRQQQMMSFLAKATNSETNKKRRLKQDGIIDKDHSTASDGRLVKYQPLMNDAKAMLMQMMKGDASPRLDSFNNSNEHTLIGDGSSSSSGLDGGNSSSRVSGVTLQEVSPTSGISGHCPSAAISEIQSSPCTTSSERITNSRASRYVIMPDLSQILEMVPESIVDIPTEMGNDGLIDPDTLAVNGLLSIELDEIGSDPDIDALLEIESTSMEGKSKENEGQAMDDGWDKYQHMDKLTEQMGLLRSENKGI